MKNIAGLARLIILDGLRRHALLGLLLLAIFAEGAGLLFYEFIPRDIGRASNDFRVQLPAKASHTPTRTM